MARPKRFELLTPRFVVWCSLHLSQWLRPHTTPYFIASQGHLSHIVVDIARRPQTCYLCYPLVTHGLEGFLCD